MSRFVYTQAVEALELLTGQRVAPQRQALVLEELRAGRGYWGGWSPLTIGRVTLTVANDYLAIGDPSDFIRAPLDGAHAQLACDLFGATLPTKPIVDAIWRAADVKLAPSPMGPPYDHTMRSIARLVAHDARIQDALAHEPWRGALIAGHKKDVVLTNRLVDEAPAWSKVAIYGWHRRDGQPIQGPNVSLKHELTYDDYSHGIRLVKLECLVDGRPRNLLDVLGDPALCRGLTEGDAPLRARRYPLPSSPAAQSVPPVASPPKLERGSRGAHVSTWQGLLNRAGADPALTVDGAFGPRTAAATAAWRASAGLPPGEFVDATAWQRMTERVDAPPVAASIDAPPALPEVKFVRARFFRSVPKSTPRAIDLIVLHTMEAAEKSNTAEAVAAYFAAGCPDAKGNLRQASAHFNVDNDSIVQSVLVEDVAFHAAGTNHNGIGIEHAGYANQDAAGWGDTYSVAMLRLSAALCAKLSKDHDIPIAWVDADGLLAGKRGFTSHANVSAACRLAAQRNATSSSFFGKKSTHYDPGKAFPVETYLDLVRTARGSLG